MLNIKVPAPLKHLLKPHYFKVRCNQLFCLLILALDRNFQSKVYMCKGSWFMYVSWVDTSNEQLTAIQFTMATKLFGLLWQQHMHFA